MLPQGEVFTPTDTVPVLLNTTDPATGEAAAWTTGTIRLMRLRGDPATTTNWTEVTDDVGYALTINWDPSASPRTGLHVSHVDLDGLTSAALAGDLYVVVGSGGTVSTENMINLALAYFWVQSDGLTTQQKADVNTEADTAVAPVLTQRSVPEKGVAFTFGFKMVDETDLATGEPSLTVTATISKDGAAFAAAAGTVSEIGNGWYELAATTADMNANRLIFRFTATGAAPTEIPITTDGGV